MGKNTAKYETCDKCGRKYNLRGCFGRNAKGCYHCKPSNDKLSTTYWRYCKVCGTHITQGVNSPLGSKGYCFGCEKTLPLHITRFTDQKASL